MTTNRTSLFAVAAFLAAFTLSPSANAEGTILDAFKKPPPPPAVRAERAAVQAETAAVAAVDAAAATQRTAQLSELERQRTGQPSQAAPGYPLGAAGSEEARQPETKIQKKGKKRDQSGGGSGIFHGVVKVVNPDLPCVQKYLGLIAQMGMAPAPDLYGAELPTRASQMLVYDTQTGDLSGTAVSECAADKEPVFNTPTMTALSSADEGNLTCAIYRQWWILARRAKSRVSTVKPPMITLTGDDGVTRKYYRWGDVRGDVNQNYAGYSICSPQIKAVNGGQKPQTVREYVSINLQAIIDKLNDLEARVHHLELRTPRIALGIIGSLHALRSPNAPFGLSLQFIWERYQGHMLIETGFQALAMRESLMFSKYKMSEWTLGGGWDFGLAYKWNNGFFLGGKLDFRYMQSVDVQGGLTSHGTAAAFVGAGPWVGVITGGGHLILDAGLPIGCAWEMVELKKLDGSTAFPVVPGFGLVPTVKGTVRF